MVFTECWQNTFSGKIYKIIIEFWVSITIWIILGLVTDFEIWKIYKKNTHKSISSVANHARIANN